MQIQVGNRSYITQRVFCIGRNYVAHAEELKNEVPDKPVLFMKPATSLVPPSKPVSFPKHGRNLHFETELVVLIGKEGRPVSEDDARSYVAGLSVGFDLTLRDVQDELKKKGLPWETAKAFDQSALVGDFVPYSQQMDLKNIEFTGSVNGAVRQNGHTGKMIFPIARLLMEIGKIWKLLPGDLIYTGTPEGVGPLTSGDSLSASAPWLGSFSWKVT